MNQIGAYGKTPGSNVTNHDDFSDNSDAHNFRNSRDDDASTGFNQSGLKDEGPKSRTGGRQYNRQTDDPAQQAALAARASHFQKSMNAAQHTEAATDQANIADESSENEDEAGPFSNLLGSSNNKPEQQTTGQQSLSQLFTHNNTSGKAAEFEEDPDEKLLAISEAVSSTLPLFTALQPTDAVQGVQNASRAQNIAGAIEVRVTQAIQAELAASSGSINNIRINVAGLVEGLTAITIRLSATGMDIVLSGAADGLAGEAQALADRLSKRFSNRNVRILSAPATSDESRAEDEVIPVSPAPIKGPDSIT